VKVNLRGLSEKPTVNLIIGRGSKYRHSFPLRSWDTLFCNFRFTSVTKWLDAIHWIDDSGIAFREEGLYASLAIRLSQLFLPRDAGQPLR
jgi:hypothetical protein